jgi:hypothetical protein
MKQSVRIQQNMYALMSRNECVNQNFAEPHSNSFRALFRRSVCLCDARNIRRTRLLQNAKHSPNLLIELLETKSRQPRQKHLASTKLDSTHQLLS